ncbi:MAG: ATP-binding protein, partial [Bacteroidota bacterium]
PKELAFTDSLTLVSEEASYFALDLSPSQKTMLDSFFDVDDNKKHFAIKYSTICSQDDAIPAWIGEIKSYFLS